MHKDNRAHFKTIIDIVVIIKHAMNCENIFLKYNCKYTKSLSGQCDLFCIVLLNIYCITIMKIWETRILVMKTMSQYKIFNGSFTLCKIFFPPRPGRFFIRFLSSSHLTSIEALRETGQTCIYSFPPSVSCLCSITESHSVFWVLYMLMISMHWQCDSCNLSKDV